MVGFRFTQVALVALVMGSVGTRGDTCIRSACLNLMVDVSGSMSAREVGRAQAAMRNIVNRLDLDGEAGVSIIAFAQRPEVLVACNSDQGRNRTALLNAIDDVRDANVGRSTVFGSAFDLVNASQCRDLPNFQLIFSDCSFTIPGKNQKASRRITLNRLRVFDEENPTSFTFVITGNRRSNCRRSDFRALTAGTVTATTSETQYNDDDVPAAFAALRSDFFVYSLLQFVDTVDNGWANGDFFEGLNSDWTLLLFDNNRLAVLYHTFTNANTSVYPVDQSLQAEATSNIEPQQTDIGDGTFSLAADTQITKANGLYMYGRLKTANFTNLNVGDEVRVAWTVPRVDNGTECWVFAWLKAPGPTGDRTLIAAEGFSDALEQATFASYTIPIGEAGDWKVFFNFAALDVDGSANVGCNITFWGATVH